MPVKDVERADCILMRARRQQRRIRQEPAWWVGPDGKIGGRDSRGRSASEICVGG
jgi:hypothetical protein